MKPAEIAIVLIVVCVMIAVLLPIIRVYSSAAKPTPAQPKPTEPKSPNGRWYSTDAARPWLIKPLDTDGWPLPGYMADPMLVIPTVGRENTAWTYDLLEEALPEIKAIIAERPGEGLVGGYYNPAETTSGLPMFIVITTQRVLGLVRGRPDFTRRIEIVDSSVQVRFEPSPNIRFLAPGSDPNSSVGDPDRDLVYRAHTAELANEVAALYRSLIPGGG